MRIFTRSLKTQFIEAFTLLILLSSCFLAAITGREASSEARYERGLLLTNRVQSLAKALDQSMWFWIKEVDTLRHTVGLIGGDMKKLSIAVNRLQDTMPAFAWIGLMNPQGKVFIATDGVLEGTDLSICAIFRQGKNGLFVGDVRKASLLAQLLPQPENGPLKFVDISMPIGEGELKDWVLVAHLSWAWAREVEEFILSAKARIPTPRSWFSVQTAVSSWAATTMKNRWPCPCCKNLNTPLRPGPWKHGPMALPTSLRQ